MWINLTDESQLKEIKEKSNTRPQLIFKHSTRCVLSSMAKNRLDKSSRPTDIDFYFLDLIKHRNISNQISREFNVYHESPQVLLIKNGESVYDQSHSGIDMKEITTHALRA
jgi:bacillithiol system protein YtxJ